MELKPYEKANDQQRQSAMSSLALGGAGAGGMALREFLKLAKEHKDYVPETIKDGNVLQLRKQKPPLLKWLKQNPQTMKSILKAGEAGIVAGGAKGLLAGGVLGALTPYLFGGDNESSR